MTVSGSNTPTAIAGNTNDYNHASLATTSWLRISATAAFNLTGIVAQASNTMLTLENVGGFTITLNGQDPSSSAVNRFAFPRAYVLRPSQTLTLKYDPTLTRWVATSVVTA